MKFTAAALGLAATAAAVPGAAPDNLRPDAKAPAGCSENYDGQFELSIFKLAKRQLIQKRDTLVLTLKNGVLKDSQDRTGAIVANYQFQFDGPPQAGSIYTAGFSTCQNGSLALGGSTVFYQCLSGDFYNLYDRHWAAQCEPVEIVAQPHGKAPAGGSQAPAGNGKNTVGTSMVVTTIVTALPDGQPQVVTTQVPVPLCQIGDGQIQAHTTPCDKVPNNPPVSQIGDGQIQAPTNPPVITQIGDGQIQAPTGGAKVSQIGDGQVQAPSGGNKVSQIGDGQVQAPTGGAKVSQIGDGQIQAPTGGPAPTAPATVPHAGAGRSVPAMGGLLAAGLAAVFFL